MHLYLTSVHRRRVWLCLNKAVVPGLLSTFSASNLGCQLTEQVTDNLTYDCELLVYSGVDTRVHCVHSREVSRPCQRARVEISHRSSCLP